MGKVKIWNTTTGNVGESPAPVWNVQYWFTLKGILGKTNGAVAAAGSEKRSMGFMIFTMLRTSSGEVSLSDNAISFALRGSHSTTLPAFWIAFANRLSS